MSDGKIMTDPADMAPHDDAPRRRPVQREWELQRACRVFCRDAIDLPPTHWQFLAFDSAQKATDNQRARMVARGVVPGTPDCAVFAASMPPVWLELKWGKNSRPSSDQTLLLGKLNDLGHYAAIARSVSDVRFHLGAAGIPLRRNAELIAADLDLKVAARISKAEQRSITPGLAPKRAPRFLSNKRMTKTLNAG